MATPAEKKALIFLAAVAVLGGGVRLWRTMSVRPVPSARAEEDSDRTADAPRSRPKKERSGGRRSTNRRSSPAALIDSTLPVIDLDVGSPGEIAMLDPLAPGMMRLIVANRDSFGAFGSLRELGRVPYLTSGMIRKLAPHVTFSRLPRPTNTVIQGPTGPSESRVDGATHRARHGSSGGVSRSTKSRR